MLTTKQLRDIELLQKECEIHDNLQLKLNWDMLKTRSDDHHDFLLYDKNELISFSWIIPFWYDIGNLWHGKATGT